jgi:anti-sigma regulatory factor (Ser/Thr protein kinase)
MEKIFKYNSDIQDIPGIRNDLLEVSKQWKIPGSELRQISLIIEELFSNIVRFAYEDQKTHPIEVRLLKGVGEIVLTIIDDGIPFNPLEYQPTPASDPAASEEGGMGLVLVQTFSDAIRYYRKENKNHLEITKKIKSNLTSNAED